MFSSSATNPRRSAPLMRPEAISPDLIASQPSSWADGETPTTAPSSSDASPSQAGGGASQAGGVWTMRPEALNERLMQGATPPVRRADALGSTTPAAADSTPIEVAARPEQPLESAQEPADEPQAQPTPNASGLIPPAPARQSYATLIGRDDAGAEKRCLAEAIYFEARGESEEGQAAVAQVVLNRVSSGLYPASICGVVYQNRQRRNACQFSFACDGRSLRVTEPTPGGRRSASRARCPPARLTCPMSEARRTITRITCGRAGPEASKKWMSSGVTFSTSFALARPDGIACVFAARTCVRP